MAHQHSTPTPDLDEGSATALVTLEGLALFCFTSQRGYVGGFLRNPHHAFGLEVRGLGPRPIHVGGDGDITIEVVNPVRSGMHRFEGNSFNRQLPDNNDERDFRWIIDAEGAEMHGIDLDEGNGPLLRRLSVNSGTIYTKGLRDEEFVRVRIDEPGEPCTFYGKFAKVVGIALECRDGQGSGIRIRTEGAGGEDIFLPKSPGARYEIKFKNLRGPHHPHQGSDFLLYYDVMSDPRGIRYDFVQAVGPGDPRGHGDPCLGPVEKFRDGMGLACDNTYLSKTSELS